MISRDIHTNIICQKTSGPVQIETNRRGREASFHFPRLAQASGYSRVCLAYRSRRAYALKLSTATEHEAFPGWRRMGVSATHLSLQRVGENEKERQREREKTAGRFIDQKAARYSASSVCAHLHLDVALRANGIRLDARLSSPFTSSALFLSVLNGVVVVVAVTLHPSSSRLAAVSEDVLSSRAGRRRHEHESVEHVIHITPAHNEPSTTSARSLLSHDSDSVHSARFAHLHCANNPNTTPRRATRSTGTGQNGVRHCPATPTPERGLIGLSGERDGVRTHRQESRQSPAISPSPPTSPLRTRGETQRQRRNEQVP